MNKIYFSNGNQRSVLVATFTCIGHVRLDVLLVRPNSTHKIMEPFLLRQRPQVCAAIPKYQSISFFSFTSQQQKKETTKNVRFASNIK